MLTFYNKYQGGKYSQNGEAAIIDECLRRMNRDKGIAIEFGAPTKEYCSNIFHLEEKGWYCMYYDNNPSGPGIMKAEITKENINSLIPSCNVISMDTDGMDYELLMAWDNKSDIIVIEINSSLSPDIDHSSKEKGASYMTMATLLLAKGYFILCHTGNIIAVADKYRSLFPEIEGNGIENYLDYFNKKWLEI